MKAALAVLLLSAACCAAQTNFDWPVLVDAIKAHENSMKFPYGCERRVHGGLVGFPEPEARARCLAICRRVHARWLAGGRTGEYWAALNRAYAADPRWREGVERIYRKMLTSGRRPPNLAAPVGKEPGANNRKPRTQ